MIKKKKGKRKESEKERTKPNQIIYNFFWIIVGKRVTSQKKQTKKPLLQFSLSKSLNLVAVFETRREQSRLRAASSAIRLESLPSSHSQVDDSQKQCGREFPFRHFHPGISIVVSVKRAWMQVCETSHCWRSAMIESAPIVAGGVPPRHSFTICNCLRLFLRHPIPSDPIRSHPSHYFTFDPYFFVLLARLVSGWDEKASRYPIPNPADLNPKIFGLQTAIFNRPVSQRLPLSASSSVERIRFFGNIFFWFFAASKCESLQFILSRSHGRGVENGNADECGSKQEVESVEAASLILFFCCCCCCCCCCGCCGCCCLCLKVVAVIRLAFLAFFSATFRTIYQWNSVGFVLFFSPPPLPPASLAPLITPERTNGGGGGFQMNPPIRWDRCGNAASWEQLKARNWRITNKQEG